MKIHDGRRCLCVEFPVRTQAGPRKAGVDKRKLKLLYGFAHSRPCVARLEFALIVINGFENYVAGEF